MWCCSLLHHRAGWLKNWWGLQFCVLVSRKLHKVGKQTMGNPEGQAAAVYISVKPMMDFGLLVLLQSGRGWTHVMDSVGMTERSQNAQWKNGGVKKKRGARPLQLIRTSGLKKTHTCVDHRGSRFYSVLAAGYAERALWCWPLLWQPFTCLWLRVLLSCTRT